MPSKPHQHHVRVYYEDTDTGGIVYHAAYVKFAERARTEFLRACGFEQRSLYEKEKLFFAAYKLRLHFKAPSRLDDLLTIETTAQKIHGSKIDFLQEIKRDNMLLVVIHAEIATVNLEGKPIRIPSFLRDRIEKEALNPIS